MKRIKEQEGITIVALIITIIVVLILAAVTINAIQDNGIITHAKNVTNKYEISAEKEKLKRGVLTWQTLGKDTLGNYFKQKYGEEKVQLNADDSITVEVESGDRYVVTEDGETILLDGTVEESTPIQPEIILNKTSISKEITHGVSVTENLTARLNNAEGTLTWVSSAPDVAEITTSEGNTRTIELKKAGTATITVTYAENTSIVATCTVTVTEKEITLKVTPTTISEEIESGSTVTKTLTATLTNASGDLSWTTSNASVASVTGNGKTATVTLKAEGTAIITVSYGEYSETCNLTVTEVEAVSMIEFTIDGTIYYAEDGMTWGEWVESEYNTVDAYVGNMGIMVR